jgi:hypothetical protein
MGLRRERARELGKARRKNPLGSKRLVLIDRHVEHHRENSLARIGSVHVTSVMRLGRSPVLVLRQYEGTDDELVVRVNREPRADLPREAHIRNRADECLPIFDGNAWRSIQVM